MQKGGRINLVILVKDRLLSIDAILPLLLEIKKSHPDIKPLVVIPSEKTYDVVELNYHIKDALQKVGAEIECPMRDRLSLLIWQAGLLLKCLFARNLFIKFGSTLYRHNAFMRILKALSKTEELKVHMLPFQRQYLEYMREDIKLKHELAPQSYSECFDFFEDTFDRFISTASYEDMQMVSCGGSREIPSERLIRIGHIRALPEWSRFVEQESKSCAAINSGPYCLFILTCLKKRLEAFDEPRLESLLAESLDVLKNFNSQITIVFRPHAITEMDILQRVIDESGITNYRIDHGHPMILSSKAKFVIGTLFSTTMFDSWWQGVPTIEYCRYDREFFKRLGKRSFGGDACDFFIDRDPEQLRKAVANILSGRFKPVRDQKIIERDYPKDSGELFDYVNKFYGSSS